MTFAAGLAGEGMRPVFAIYSTFLQRAYDQVIHDVALQNLPVTSAIDRGGLVGEDGATHQGVFDVAYLRRDSQHGGHGAEGRERAAAHALHRPAATRAPRPCATRGKARVRWTRRCRQLPIGRGEVLQEGTDVVLVGLGTMARVCQEAARLLAEKSISTMVINPRYVKPLDADLLLAAGRQVGAVVTVEEACLAGSFGSAVLELFAAHGVDAHVTRMGIPDEFVDHGKPAHFLERYGLTPEGVAQRRRSSCCCRSAPTCRLSRPGPSGPCGTWARRPPAANGPEERGYGRRTT